MRILIKNIKQLIQTSKDPATLLKKGTEMAQMDVVENGWLIIEDSKIKNFGDSTTFPSQERFDKEIDATGRVVMPALCDCHTHIVYAGSREKEFFDKIRGLSYQEIAKRGGGILNSADLLSKTSEGELFQQAMERVREITAKGTGSVEIKSGYGLNPADEIKMLRVIKRISEESQLTVKSTFLGAHAFPQRYKEDHAGYVDEIINEMIPVIATEELADYIDIFCEEGFFSIEDTDRILNAGIKYGLRPKVHANQMGFSGGVQMGVKYNAISVDHLEFTGDEEFELLANSDTMPVLLPGATMFLKMDYAPAQKMLERGLPLAVASNYNPGSCPSGDLMFMMFLACQHYKFTAEQAINATTINSAYAIDLSETKGTIAVGKDADLLITKPVPSYEFLPYSFTTPLIERMILGGKEISL